MDQTDTILPNELHREYNAMIDDVLQTLDGAFGVQNNILPDTMNNPPSVSSISSTSSSPTFATTSQANYPNLEGVHIKIVEEPAPKGLRFRYVCEGRSAGSIPGIHSTPENKTFPTIEIVGYEGEVKIVVSCVTKDEPYRPHPHNLVGKEGCEFGICKMRINGPPMRAVFSNLGIQCVKKKEIESSLEKREEINVDPFKTKFAHRDQPSSIDLNVVRLCFQAFIPIPGKRNQHSQSGKPQFFKLAPVVSEPIFDKKSITDLNICRLCSCSAKVTGGDTIFLLCEKVIKDDIKIRFYEERDNDLYWEDFAEFQQTDVHKQAAIAFKTPVYINPDINHKVQVYIQLYRPSDGDTSEPRPFELYPDPGMRTFPRIHRKLKSKQDMDIFQQILSFDSETNATKYSVPSTVDAAENDNDTEGTVTSDSTASKPLSSDTLNENEELQKRPNESFEDDDDTGNYNYFEHNSGEMEIELPVPRISFPTIDDSTQTSTPIEDILHDRQLEGESRQFSTLDKITEWMKSNEYERTDSLVVENGDTMSLGGTEITPKQIATVLNTNDKCTKTTTLADSEQMNSVLIEQDIELDEKCCLELLAKRLDTFESQQVVGKYQPQPIGAYHTEDVDSFNCSASAQISVDIDESFDESATYTSLQRALKNPIEIPIEHPNNENRDYTLSAKTEKDLVILTNPPAPKIQVNAAQTPTDQTPSSPPLPLPPRTPSPVSDQMLPPLPPKRKPSQELWAGVNSDSSPCHTAGSSRNGSICSRPPSQIIVMRTPDQSPTKRSATSTPSPKKKQSFFTRLFSRRKSKSQAPTSGDDSNSKVTTPNQSREPSIGNFSLNDNNRASIRSAKSLQPNSTGLEPRSSEKTGKAVGRSASSVSENLKRKRIKTGGNPMNLLREIQQIEQNQTQSQMQYNNFNLSNMDFTSIWNTTSPSSNASANPELKPEPFLSPNYFGGTYRNTYQASPSPQPLSPMMNRNFNTPSPGLVRNSSAESNTQMANIYNQSQMTTTEHYQQNMPSNYNMSPNIATNHLQDGFNNTNEYIGNNLLSPQQTQFTTFNPSFNRTSGGRFSPISANDSNANNQISNTSQLQAINIMNNNMHNPAVQGTTNVHFHGSIISAATTNNNNNNNPNNSFANNYLTNNLIPVQDQQQAIPNGNMMFNHFPDPAAAVAVPPDSAEELLNNLMLIDTNDFVNINTEEFRISNLSIST